MKPESFFKATALFLFIFSVQQTEAMWSFKRSSRSKSPSSSRSLSPKPKTKIPDNTVVSESDAREHYIKWHARSRAAYKSPEEERTAEALAVRHKALAKANAWEREMYRPDGRTVTKAKIRANNAEELAKPKAW